MPDPLSNHTDLIGKMKQEAAGDTTVQQTARKRRRKNAFLKLLFGLGASFTGGYWIYYEVTHLKSIEPGNWTPLFLLIIGGAAILSGGVQLYRDRAVGHGEVGLGFGLLWALVSGIGNVVGLILGFLVFWGMFVMWSGGPSDQAADSLPTLGLIPSALIVSLIPAAVGLGLGAAQWLMLRKQIVRAGWWVAATMLGFAIPAFIVLALGISPSDLGVPDTPDVTFAVVAGVSLGISVGLAQWLVLRRHVSGAGWWVLASLLGFSGTAAGMVIGSDQPAVTFLGLAGYGAITALAMVWLLRRSFLRR